ncbi:uncharacterized protein A4U43_C08F35780 [Asparagus officinalis]|nr:uncharacterized protein A4U43_C08F35780 [Asparagus officinalis]
MTRLDWAETGSRRSKRGALFSEPISDGDLGAGFGSMSYSRRSSRYRSPSCSPYRRNRSFSRSRGRSRSQDSSDVENPGNNLYVTGLSSRITKSELEKHFASEGKVSDVHLVADPWTRESRGFGFVTMDTLEDADRCIKYLDGSILEGRVITVEKARRRCGRTPTPGRYLGARTGRHRSRSYSPYYRGRYSSPDYYSERDRSYSPYYRSRHRSRSYSPYYRSRHRSRSYSPYYRRHRSRSYSPYYGRRHRSRSYSPYYRRHRSRSYSPCYERRHRSRSYSPYYERRHRSYSRDSRSYSPERSVLRSVSPVTRRSLRRNPPSVSPRPRRSKRSYSPSVSPDVRGRSRRSYSRSLSPGSRGGSSKRSGSRSYSSKRSRRSPSSSCSESPRRSKRRHSRESYSHSRSMGSRSVSSSPVRSA